MDQQQILKWGSRIILIIFIVFIIWFLTRNKNIGIKIKKTKMDKFIFNNLKENIYNFTKLKQRVKSKKINKTEEKCRKIIEKIYNRKFPSIRPSFLKNPKTKKNLEIDCYNSELKIGLEYNGQQHYKYTPFFHKKKSNFFSQVFRDDWKRKKCGELGITLIEIPYWITEMNLENYIQKELLKKKVL